MMIEKIKRIILSAPLFPIVFLGFVVYINALNGMFLWDDVALVMNNAYIKDWSKIPNIFTENIGSGSLADTSFYRPLQEVIHMLDYSVFKLNVFGYHLTSILLHILVALAIYRLFSILYKDKTISWLMSLLFVIFPGHTEAVSYVSGLGDILSALFILQCLIFYIKYLDSEKPAMYLFACLCAVLAILSKENALILPALLLLYHCAFKRKIKLRLFLPFLAVAFLYILLRMGILSYVYQGPAIILRRIPGFFVAITNYLRILLLPINLHADYGNALFHILNPKALFGLTVSILLLIYAYRERRRDNFIFFPIFWFFIAMLPTTSIYPILHFYMAEHWLYLPSIGFFAILANLLIRLYRVNKFRHLAMGLAAGIVALYLYSTFYQNNYWREPVAFYQRTLKYVPLSADINLNLGREYLLGNDTQKAIEQFRKTLLIDPKNYLAYYNLAEAYSKEANNKKALEYLQKTIEINPAYANAYNDICNIYVSLDKNEEAIISCKKAIELKPKFASAHYNLGNAYYNLGNKKEAMEAYEKVLAINPDYFEAFNNLASAYADDKKVEKAIGLWNKLIQRNPNFSTAHFNLAVFYYQEGKYDLAIKHCDKVIALGDEIDPKFLELLKPHRK